MTGGPRALHSCAAEWLGVPIPKIATQKTSDSSGKGISYLSSTSWPVCISSCRKKNSAEFSEINEKSGETQPLPNKLRLFTGCSIKMSLGWLKATNVFYLHPTTPSHYRSETLRHWIDIIPPRLDFSRSSISGSYSYSFAITFICRNRAPAISSMPPLEFLAKLGSFFSLRPSPTISQYDLLCSIKLQGVWIQELFLPCRTYLYLHRLPSQSKNSYRQSQPEL